MIGETGRRTFANAGTAAALSAFIGLLYGTGAIALLPVLLDDFVVYEYALDAVAGVTLLIIGLSFGLGCIAAVPLASIVSPSIGLAVATTLAGSSGVLSCVLPSGSFPSEIVITLGLYAAAAPIVVATAGGNASSRSSGLLSSGAAFTAMAVGIVPALLFHGIFEVSATVPFVTSLALLIIATLLWLRAVRTSAAPLTTAVSN